MDGPTQQVVLTNRMVRLSKVVRLRLRRARRNVHTLDKPTNSERVRMLRLEDSNQAASSTRDRHQQRLEGMGIQVSNLRRHSRHMGCHKPNRKYPSNPNIPIPTCRINLLNHHTVNLSTELPKAAIKLQETAINLLVSSRACRG